MLKAVGPSKVAQYLAAKGAPVLQKGFVKLQKLSQNEQTHDDAAEKREQSEKAVVIPVSDGQSKSNAAQVSAVSDRPTPAADENRGKKQLQDSLNENLPRRVEDVDNFKRDHKAEHIGSDVMKVVLQDKNAVVSTYQDVGLTPPPAPREHEPEDLPPQETAPGTPTMNLGLGTIAPLQKEHTDVSNFTKDADKKLDEEGVTQEQLDMVDSGDLASANKEKKGMVQMAKEEPLAIQKFAKQETASVDKELKQEENQQRQNMRAKRKSGLGATTQKQKAAKNNLEKKREEVAAKINGMYTAAQDKVTKRLADLETESMKRFDAGNARATKRFEDTVNQELAAFKADRYSGWFGWARKLRDWWKGMDELPAVKAIFERNRAVFVTTINKLVEEISADNKRVIQECKDELQNARSKIAEFVKGLRPSLQDIGKKAAEEMNSKLNEMDKFIARKEEELQEKLKDKQIAAIKAIDEKIEKMKEAMAGALAKLGRLLLWAAKKFFTWALGKFGYSLSEIQSIIDKGVAVLKAIFTKPIVFVKNLMKAATRGFENFGANFLKHLKDALFEWLTGSLKGIKLPSTWDSKGIMSVAFQMIGVSKENMRQHLVAVMGEQVVSGLESTLEIVKKLINEGPMAAWEQLKHLAAEMRDAFIDAVKEYIQQKIVQEAIIWVGSLLIPGAGIIKAIIGIYDTIVFFIKKAKEIAQMIGNFLGSIAEIAAGNIGAAADALERGLARGLKLVISFLASLLRLSGVTNKIREFIQKIRGKVDDALRKVALWVAGKAGKIAGGLASRALGGDPKVAPEQRLREGMTAALTAVNRYAGKRVGAVVLRPLLATIRVRYGLKSLDVVARGRKWAVRGVINPEEERPSLAEVIEAGDQLYTATFLGDQIVVLEDRTGRIVTLPAGLPVAARVEELRKGFELKGGTKEAQALMHEINSAGRSRPLPGNMLLSFARRTPNPVLFLTQRLEAGANPMDAVDRPVPRAIRDRLVNIGTDEPGEEGTQRQSLSPYALVFIENYRGQFKPKTSGSVQFTEYQYERKPMTPDVFAFCVVKVGDEGADDGKIVEVIKVHQQVKGGIATAIDLMKKKPWPMK